MTVSLSASLMGADDVRKYLQKAGAAVKDAAYFAAIDAANDSKDAVLSEMRKTFDRPTPFILRALRLTNATGGAVGKTVKQTNQFGQTKRIAQTNFEVKLGFVDAYATNRHDPVTDTIHPQVEGGARAAKPVELRLRRAGILSGNEFIAPASGATRNRYGNIPPGEFVRMLSDLRTFTERGFNANSKYKKRKTGHYFVAGGGGFRGIFRTTGGGAAYNSKSVSNAKLVWLIVRGAPRYKKRLPFYRVAEDTYSSAYPSHFERTLKKQLAKVT